jgi:putative inorganic carbon (hco3(-)) transporter
LIKRGDFFALIVVTLLFNYAIAIGTNFNGILNPEFHTLTLALTGVTSAGWLLLHWRRGWVWHRTSLDVVMLLWIAAFGLSLVANLEVWRRIAIGLWYVAAYIGVWYMLYDLIANNALSRDTLVDGLLICGLVVLIFGFIQSRNWFIVSLPLILSRTIPFGLPRPVSTFGNANTLANFLIVLIPFALTRAVSARLLFGRIVMGIYALLALLLLFLTYSRGGWLGMVAGLFIWAVLLLAQRNLLSPKGLTLWWGGKTSRNRSIILAAAALSGVVAIAVLMIFVSSLNAGGRTADLRTYIYDTAITMFTEKPLTGHGLFTFGRGLTRLQSVPPTTPHNHAHNAPLHIAAEMGVAGLVALFATLAVMVWQAWRNWRDMSIRQRPLLSAAAGAVVAFAVHQLTDVPATTPAIVLTGLVALVLLLTPVNLIPLTSHFRRISHSVLMTGLWLVLLITGLWSSQVYTQYINALHYAVDTKDFRGAASQMQPVINADPDLSLTYKEQGLLFGLAANEGDQDSAREGIAAYQKFLELDPYYAIVWANMAALQWQLDERDAAFESMEQAVKLAPQSWQLAVGLGFYADAMAKTEFAQISYQQALTIYPDSVLLPELAIFRSDDLKLTIPARVVLLLDEGKIDEAAQVWSDNPQPVSLPKYVIDTLVALAQNDRSGAQTALSAAEESAVSDIDKAWLYIGQASLAQFDGDNDVAAAELEMTRQQLTRDTLDVDFEFGINIALAQFLRNGFSRTFLPQVYYPADDPVLLYLIENT